MSFRAGEVLLHHGDQSGQCSAILDGDLMVTTASTQDNTVILGHRGAGVVIGNRRVQSAGRVFGSIVGDAQRQAPCDVVVVKAHGN